MNNNKNRSNTNKHLVYGTWSLVVVTLFIGLFTCNKMGKQVEEMKRATNLQWRPFLNIQIDTCNQYFNYCLAEDIEDTTAWRGLCGFSPTSDSYRAVRSVINITEISRCVTNSGITPLRITYLREKCIDHKRWVSIYKKNASLLMRDVKGLPDKDSIEIDMVIFPNESHIIPLGKLGKIDIPIKLFEYYRDSLKELYLYPYIFAEYEDFFGNRYNSILIYLQKFAFIKNDSCIYPSLQMSAIEQYRWDVAY